MCPSAILSTAVSMGLTYGLPAPQAEFDAFTKGGDVRTTLGEAKGRRLFSVTVGTIGDRVAFVVLAMADPTDKSFTCPVVAGTGSTFGGGLKTPVSKTTAELNLPGGKTVPLPLRPQLIEVANGKVRAGARRVTKDEIDAFLKSKPDDYSLDSFLRFVDDRRKATGK